MEAKMQDLKADMNNSINQVMAKVIALIATKPAPSIVIGQEVLELTNRQALDFKRETESMKSHLGR